MHGTAQHESGTALLVVLLLVFVSSLLGVAAFDDSAISVKLVANDVYRESAFRAAESQSNLLLQPDTVQVLLNSGQPSQADTTSVIDNVTTDAELRLDGVGLPKGYSLGEGVAGFAAYKLTATATSTIASVRAARTVTQGAEQYAPKP